MVASRSGSPVAQAAEWLTRQGIAVPAPGGAAGADGSAETGSGPSVGSGPAEQPDHPATRRGSRPLPAPATDEPATDEPAPGGARSASGPDGDTDADPYAVARSIALDRIAARDRTRHELAQALSTKNVPAEVAEQVLDRLEEVGLVNDAAFADAWVESRQRRRHLSRPALRRELQAKGVDRDQIDAALESVDVGDELAAARELAERRHAAIAELPYPVRYRRLAGALSRRGFGSAVVTEVLREVVGRE